MLHDDIGNLPLTRSDGLLLQHALGLWDELLGPNRRTGRSEAEHAAAKFTKTHVEEMNVRLGILLDRQA